jgi:hypothetical protein
MKWECDAMNHLRANLACLFASLALFTAPAMAKDTSICDAYVGSTVVPQSFASATQRYRAIPAKDEFETTSDYEKKVSGLVGTPGPLVIGKKPEGPEYLIYDADSQALNVQSFAFHNTTLHMYDALKDSGVKTDYSENLYTVISQVDRVTGTYRASNAFGASTTVSKWTWTMSAMGFSANCRKM